MILLRSVHRKSEQSSVHVHELELMSKVIEVRFMNIERELNGKSSVPTILCKYL